MMQTQHVSIQTMMVVEVRQRDGSTLESEGTPIYEVLNGAYIGYRGTYEQLSTVADVAIRFTDFLSIDAESGEVLVRNQFSNTWHSLNALESSEAVRTIETDIQLITNNINAVIYRLEQEQPNFDVIGAMAQAYGWVEQAQQYLETCDTHQRIRGDADYDTQAPQEHAYLNRDINDARSQS